MGRYRLCHLPPNGYALIDFVSNKLIWHTGTFHSRHYLLRYEILSVSTILTLDQFKQSYPEFFI